jgi:hypothetical protein
MKSKVFNLAWDFLKSNLFTTFSAALKAAWKTIKIKSGQVRAFSYTKKDGSLRNATAIPAPANYPYQSTDCGSPLNIVRYFDADAMAFRSFDVSRLSI